MYQHDLRSTRRYQQTPASGPHPHMSFGGELSIFLVLRSVRGHKCSRIRCSDETYLIEWRALLRRHFLPLFAMLKQAGVRPTALVTQKIQYEPRCSVEWCVFHGNSVSSTSWLASDPRMCGGVPCRVVAFPLVFHLCSSFSVGSYSAPDGMANLSLSTLHSRISP